MANFDWRTASTDEIGEHLRLHPTALSNLKAEASMLHSEARYSNPDYAALDAEMTAFHGRMHEQPWPDQFRIASQAREHFQGRKTAWQVEQKRQADDAFRQRAAERHEEIQRGAQQSVAAQLTGPTRLVLDRLAAHIDRLRVTLGQVQNETHLDLICREFAAELTTIATALHPPEKPARRLRSVT